MFAKINTLFVQAQVRRDLAQKLRTLRKPTIMAIARRTLRVMLLVERVELFDPDDGHTILETGLGARLGEIVVDLACTEQKALRGRRGGRIVEKLVEASVHEIVDR